MNKNINWYKIFNNKNFIYSRNSKEIKNTNYTYHSYSLAKVIYPELNYIKFKSIIIFMEKILRIKKKKSILDFGSGNGAFLNFFIKKYNLRDNYSFELSLPLINFQKKFIQKTNFYQTHYSNCKIFNKLNSGKIADYSISNSVFQYFYNNSYCLKVLDFLIGATRKRILIYDIKDYDKKKLYKEKVRYRQNLSKTDFNNKYKNTPIKFYKKNFFIKTMNILKKKHNIDYRFISLPVSATDSEFGYCLIIKINS